MIAHRREPDDDIVETELFVRVKNLCEFLDRAAEVRRGLSIVRQERCRVRALQHLGAGRVEWESFSCPGLHPSVQVFDPVARPA